MSFSAGSASTTGGYDTSLTRLPWMKRQEQSSMSGVVFSKNALGPDIASQLVLSLIYWNQFLVSPLMIRIHEFREIERRMNRLRALQDVVGILADLTSEELEVFSKAAERNPSHDEVHP